MKVIYQHLVSFICLIGAVVFLLASASSRELSYSDKTYEDPRKNAGTKDVDISYELPIIKPASQTKQMQTKGGVTVSCEVNNFVVDRKLSEERNPTFADGNKPGYDLFEITRKPSYDVSPNDITFKITIKNNQDRVLKLIDVPIVMIVDGTQYSIPNDYLLEWKNALVVKGFSKDYAIKGPQIKGLNNGKAVYISINDVPTSYDRAGNVTNKENFEWYFQTSLETKTIHEKLETAYEDVLVEQKKCEACSGVGSHSKEVKCSVCDGYGKYKNREGKVVECYNCSGAGKVIEKTACGTCNSIGILRFPKSPEAKITNLVNWSGYKVKVFTKPTAVGTVSVMNPKTHKYEGTNGNKEVQWFSTDGKKEYPIIAEYNGKKVSFVPFNDKGKISSSVIVDFTPSEPTVKDGTIRK